MGKNKIKEKANLDLRDDVIRIDACYGGAFVPDKEYPNESKLLSEIDYEYNRQFGSFARAGLIFGGVTILGVAVGLFGESVTTLLTSTGIGAATGAVIGFIGGGITGILHLGKKNRLVEVLEENQWTVIKPGFSLTGGDIYGAEAYKVKAKTL